MGSGIRQRGRCPVSAGSVYARDWRAVRRLTEREAVQRGNAAFWYGNARMAAREGGDMAKAEHWTNMARRAAAKAAAYRARIMNRCDGNGGRD